MFHPSAALRSADVERQSYDDIAVLPRVLRGGANPTSRGPRHGEPAAVTPPAPIPEPRDDAPTLF